MTNPNVDPASIKGDQFTGVTPSGNPSDYLRGVASSFDQADVKDLLGAGYDAGVDSLKSDTSAAIDEAYKADLGQKKSNDAGDTKQDVAKSVQGQPEPVVISIKPDSIKQDEVIPPQRPAADVSGQADGSPNPRVVVDASVVKPDKGSGSNSRWFRRKKEPPTDSGISPAPTTAAGVDNGVHIIGDPLMGGANVAHPNTDTNTGQDDNPDNRPDADNTLSNAEVEPELTLEEARDRVAELSLKLRGRNTNKLSPKLKREYDDASDAYFDKYLAESDAKVEELKAQGLSDQEIAQLAVIGSIQERSLFTKAEFEAYDRLNANKGKIARFGANLTEKWAEASFKKRIAIGAAVGAIAAGTMMVAGTIGAGAGFGFLANRVGRKVGMYKLNKDASNLKTFSQKANNDRQAIANQMSDTNNPVHDISEFSAKTVLGSIDGRIERDQSHNRKRVAIALGSVAAGAVIGWGVRNAIEFFVNRSHHISTGLGDHHENSSPATTMPETTAPTATTDHINNTPTTIAETHTTVPTTETSLHPSTTTTVEEATPTSSRPPVVPRSSNTARDVINPNEQVAPVIPLFPEDVPVPTAEAVPDFGLDRLNWEFAHDLAPGHETEIMQRGIAAFNSANHTDFALTSHNGSVWIMDGGHAITPEQMAEMNRLSLVAYANMLDENEIVLPVAA